MLARTIALQFFGQNRHTERASLHALHHTELQNLHDLVYRRAGLERILDVTPCAGTVDVHVRGIECDEQQLLLLGSKHTFRVERGKHTHVLICPNGVEENKGIPFFAPVPHRLQLFHAECSGSNPLQPVPAQGAKVFQTANTGFLQKNGRVKAAGVNGHDRSALENEQDLLAARACSDGRPDMAARPFRV